MTKRIWVLIHFGYNFTFLWIAAVNLAVRGSITVEVHSIAW
jgi:hypothetical protein